MHVTTTARAAAAACLFVGLGVVFTAISANATGDKPGRYTMSPADGGGFVRLDTQTGAMALCQRSAGDWTCREMAEPARGLAEEVERLRGENERLRSEIRQMEEILLGEKRAETKRPRGPDFKLPTEEDVDQAMSYVQRMLRRLREKWKELEAEGKGTPL
jgi:hypothetical protein